LLDAWGREPVIIRIVPPFTGAINKLVLVRILLMLAAVAGVARNTNTEVRVA
jgi:hypothetical protein